MYRVIYRNVNKPTDIISDDKYRRIKALQTCLNISQRKWLEGVKDIVPIRKTNEHIIHRTKDVFDSNCDGCQKEAHEFMKNKSWWREDFDDMV